MQRKLPVKLSDAIRTYDRRQLKKQTVWYANTNYKWENTFVPYHGFLISDNTPVTKENDQGRVFTFIIDRMLIDYNVSPDLVTAAQQADIHSFLKQALLSLTGKKYACTEHFLRELRYSFESLCYKHGMMEPAISLIYQRDMPAIVVLNEVYNNKLGGYTPLLTPTNVAKKEKRLFLAGKVAKQPANVSPLTLVEIMHEQKRYANYLEARLGVGNAQTEEEKQRHLTDLTPQKAERISRRWVEHQEKPVGYHQANCNAAAASLLQYAQNREAKLNPLTYHPTATATWFAYAKNHRMYIHDPLLLQSCIDQLQAYYDARAAYGNKFWGSLFGKPRRMTKLKAVEKMIKRLQAHADEPALTNMEITALEQGKLGEIIKKYPLALENLHPPKSDPNQLSIPTNV